jgi:BASS family bile acid:Na+ symporter
MFEFFRGIVPPLAIAFVISAMLNVGLTQEPATILRYLRKWPFVLKMLAANFIVAPLLMFVLLRLSPLDLPLKIGLFLFSLCAGAPVLIKLTQLSQHDLALGAATMMLLMVATVVYLPFMLPLLLPGVAVDAWGIARTLLSQMLLPIAVGMAVARLLPAVTAAAQPWIARLGNLALYALLFATFVGYFRNMLGIIGTGALLVTVVFLAGAFGAGYLSGSGRDHLEDVGGLGTAQRNTAACFLIAIENFNDPNVLVMITVANTVGMVLLLFVARALSRDNVARMDVDHGRADTPA